MRSLDRSRALALTADNCVITIDENAQKSSTLFCLDEMGLPYPAEFLQKITPSVTQQQKQTPAAPRSTFGTNFGMGKPMFGGSVPAASTATGTAAAAAKPAQSAQNGENGESALECIPPLYDGGKITKTDELNEYILKLTEFVDGSAVDFEKGGEKMVLNCKKMLERTRELERENVQMIRKIQEKLGKCMELNHGKSEANVKALTEILRRLRNTRPEDDISPMKQAIERVEYNMAVLRLGEKQETVEE